MKKRNIIIGLLLLVVLVSVGLLYVQNNKSTDVFINDPIGQALRKHMIPISTVEAGNGFEDLNKLKPFIKDKKIIAMGEATHGTKEFFQMKHRMFEFLVEEMGYRVFAMETNFNSTFIVNDYILNGKGSAQKAVDSLEYFIWKTQEIFEMIEWMKKYNEDPEHKAKIRFYGFDMQSGAMEANSVENYLLKVDEKVHAQYAEYLKDINAKIVEMTDTERDELLSGLNKLEEIFVSNADNYISKSTVSEYELVRRQIEVIRQYIDYQFDNTDYAVGETLSTKRDYYMAENVKWIMNHEAQQGNDKMMIWAHNAHVGYKRETITTMGKNLKEFYGDSYYSIGFDFYMGKFRANRIYMSGNQYKYKLTNFNIESSDETMFVSKLKTAGLPIGFIDFDKAAEDNSLKKLFQRRQVFHSIGSAYSGDNKSSTETSVPKDIFDGLIYIENTSAALRVRYKN